MKKLSNKNIIKSERERKKDGKKDEGKEEVSKIGGKEIKGGKTCGKGRF
jgi:hypothetical protein